MFKSQYVHKICDDVAVLGVSVTSPMFGDLFKGLNRIYYSDIRIYSHL